jgi:alpha-beta hydrolase superfamily lysophospholipase
MSEPTAAPRETSSPPTPPRAPVEEGQLRSRDGTRLFYRRVAASGTRRGRVLVIHGFAEHGGRYLHVLGGLAAKGFEAWALDLRGHGRSDGRRAFVRRFDDYLEDVHALVETAAQDRASVPSFILGHSMGGLVSTRFVEERPAGLKGLLLSSPFFRVKYPIPLVKRAAARVLTHVTPWLALPTGLDPDSLACDPEVGRLYMADPLVTHVATTRWFTETTGAQQVALAKAASLALPVLVVAGGSDPLVDPEATRRFFAHLETPDRTIRMWDALRHEILNEREKDEILAYVIEWLEKHLGPG